MDNLQQVEAISVINGCLFAHIGKETMVIHYASTMKAIEPNLPDNFVRSHKRCIVNISHIQGVTCHEDGQMDLHMNSGETYPASRRKAPALKEALWAKPAGMKFCTDAKTLTKALMDHQDQEVVRKACWKVLTLLPEAV